MNENALENSSNALRKGYLFFNVDKRQKLILRNSFLKFPLFMFFYISFSWFVPINACSFNYQKADVPKEIQKRAHTFQVAQASSSVCLDLEEDYWP